MYPFRFRTLLLFLLPAVTIVSCIRYEAISTPGYLHALRDTVRLHSRPITPKSYNDVILRPASMRLTRTAINYKGETYYEVSLPSGTWWVHFMDALPTYEYEISKITYPYVIPTSQLSVVWDRLVTFLAYYERETVREATDQFIVSDSGRYRASRVDLGDSVQLYARYYDDELTSIPDRWHASRMIHFALTGKWEYSPLLDGVLVP